MLAGTIIRVPRNFVDTFRADADLAKIVLVRVWWCVVVAGVELQQGGSLQSTSPAAEHSGGGDQRTGSTGASAVSLVGMTTTS